MTVTQEWVSHIPLRMQSTLILSLRGPDTHAAPNIKRITRWMRGVTFKPANPGNVHEFMGHEPERIWEKGATAKELEFCTQHYYSHLMHGLEVIAYRHPVAETAEVAYKLFGDMCSLMHLPKESPADFARRLNQIEWPGGKQPDSFDEAVAIVGDIKGAHV